MKAAGFEANGTFSEYIVVPARNVLPIPEGVSFEHGAITGCAVVTQFHAMRMGEVKPGDSVAIIGIGGVGIHAVLMARLFGADRIIAVDLADYKLKLAEELGADVTVNPKEEDAVEAAKRATGERGPDAVFDFVGSTPTVLQGIRMMDRGGRVVVGLHGGTVELDMTELLYDEPRLRTSMDHTKWELRKVLELVAHGWIDLSRSITHRLPLRKVLRGFESLEEKIGNPVRAVLTP